MSCCCPTEHCVETADGKSPAQFQFVSVQETKTPSALLQSFDKGASCSLVTAEERHPIFVLLFRTLMKPP